MTNIEKLQSVIGYVAQQRPGLGKLKLFKLLYLVDFTAHADLGQSITGEQYENFEMGPVPRQLWKHFELIVGKCVTIQSVNVGAPLPEQQMRLKAGFAIDLTGDERRVIDGVIARFGDYAGNDLKRITHAQLPYRATPRGQLIPYGLAGYLNYEQPTNEVAETLRNDDALMSRLRAAVQRTQTAKA